MERLSYILDTKAIADYINTFNPTHDRINQAVLEGHRVYLCQPVRYEVLRGLISANASRKRQIFEAHFAPQLEQLVVSDEDWTKAAQFWADVRAIGKQLSDQDLLIAALAWRLNAIIVSADEDFNVLPVRRANWRKP